MSDLRLLPRADRRVRLGHAWIFSNEVDAVRTPLTGFRPGELAVVRDAAGKPVGVGYVNPGSLICARILTSDAGATIDTAWWESRIRRAAALRERLYPTPHYRLVYGESDGCPGLVVDRYGDTLVVQLNTAGTVAMREAIVEALQRVTGATGMLLRSAGSVRQLEGIAEFDEAIGEVPEIAEVVEDGTVFGAPLRTGQKTGYFYDQRDNRSRLRRYAAGKRVLDLYAYVGSWGIRAAAFGAAEAVCIDSSAAAVEQIRENARRNAVPVEAVCEDAEAALARLSAERRRFDVVVLDPPALIKRRKDVPGGARLYERLNLLALRVLEPDGVLVSCSCSHHLAPEALARVLLDAGRQAGRRLQILERHAHAPDHPVHPAMPETEYLKAFFVRA